MHREIGPDPAPLVPPRCVGGPSAGLAFTLAILDQLTPGELTGGAQVAVTGTIGIDGSVGAVGGVPQKTAAVRDLGIEYFIVPTALGEEQIADLEERAGDALEIIPVATLDEALCVSSWLSRNADGLRLVASEGLYASQLPGLPDFKPANVRGVQKR